MLENGFKNVTLYEKPFRLTQKQIKSKNHTMTMEGVVKDVMPLISNKRELFLGLHISFPWRYRGKKCNLLLSIFRYSSIPSKKQ